MAKRPTKPRVQFSYAHCQMVSTQAMKCPLCGADVPPNTRHECSRKEPRR